MKKKKSENRSIGSHQQKVSTEDFNITTIPVNEKEINFSKILDHLWQNRDRDDINIFHIDISPNITKNIDVLLIHLFILRGLSNSRGKVCQLKQNSYVVVESLQPQENATWELLCDVLPRVKCLSPNENEDPFFKDTVDCKHQWADQKLTNENKFQRPCYYLNLLEKNSGVATSFIGANHQPVVQLLSPQEVIATLKTFGKLNNPTWSQLHHLAAFLNHQLQKCEDNTFLNDEVFKQVKLKDFLVKNFIVEMAKDFALPSLAISDSSRDFGLGNIYDVHQMSRKWESERHPYVFFNADEITFTFFGVKVKNGNLVETSGHNEVVLRRNACSNALEQQLRLQFGLDKEGSENLLDEIFDDLSDDGKKLKLCRVLGVDERMNDIKFDESYELTQDNVMKLLAIHMRFRIDIPVILMGETGCGKTKLVEYLCNLMAGGRTFQAEGQQQSKPIQNMILVKIHGGLKMEELIEAIKKAEACAKRNSEAFGSNFFTVLFFDEANTTELINVIKEVICDYQCNGEKIDRSCGLRFVVACNPYRKHTASTIEKLKKQGLGFRVAAEKTKDQLTDGVPMRDLVYRVNPLPPSLLPLVWDFGQLQQDVENKYTVRIVRRNLAEFNLTENDLKFISDLLCRSQEFMRNLDDNQRFVSLRDIERAMIVFRFFYNNGTIFTETAEDREYSGCNWLAVLMVLTTGVCYHCGVEQREEYRSAISTVFRENYALPNGELSYLSEVEQCMSKFVSALEIEKNPCIAVNASLVENAFMMFICIELRIPLFLVGKPGSSKSLTKTTVTNAMQGGSSSNKFFQKFKQLQSFSFQCSQHTTAEGILSIFKQAAVWQKSKNDLERFVGVVILDEVGLAEDSEKLPLKTLHPLMESGFCEPNEEESQPNSKVSFVGISNWALDGAKMNRALLMMRGTPGIEELIMTAKTICRISAESDSPLDALIEPLANAYTILTKDENFFGLRDFYGMFKMIYNESLNSQKASFGHRQLSRIIQRNFGGTKDQGGHSNKVLNTFEEQLKQASIFNEVKNLELQKLSALGLVSQNLKEMEERQKLVTIGEENSLAVFENRYLLLMTDNLSAFHFLPQLLQLTDYEIIFGSSFPQDKEYIQLCKVMNKIKICMECGKAVVLLNLGFLHESLYDALNQCYVYYGGRRYVDMGLGTNRVKCSVDLGFRLIMVEDEQVARELPIPFLNRLEKHFLGVDCILDCKLTTCFNDLVEKLEKFSFLPRQDKTNSKFSLENVFVGYQRDTAACLLVQYRLDNVRYLDTDEDAISDWAMKKMMQMCTSDALWRNRMKYPQYISEMYESRSCLSDFLWHYIYTESRTLSTTQVELSTFCRIPSAKDIELINEELMMKKGCDDSWRDCIEVLNLSTFRTEIEFTEKVSSFYQNAKKFSAEKVKILFITCSKAERNVNLISCAKYCVQNIHQEANISRLYIIFAVSLPRNWSDSDYRCFSVGKWENFHIDDLVKDDSCQILKEIPGTLNTQFTLKQFFTLRRRDGSSTSMQNRILREVIQEAVAEMNVANKLALLNSVFDLLDNKTADQTLETVFTDKIAHMIPDSKENSLDIIELAEKSASLFQEVINAGTLEKLVFSKLKDKTKPFLRKFLELIDLGNNVHLLTHGTWERNGLTLLLGVEGICSQKTKVSQSQPIRLNFPFSSQVIRRMAGCWEQAQELHKDQQRSDIEAFIHLFRDRDERRLNEVLGLITSDNNQSIDAFQLDMIRVLLEVPSGVDSCVKSINNVLMAIRGSLNIDNNTLDYIFAVFMKMVPALRNISPIFKLISKELSIAKFEKVIKHEEKLEVNCIHFVQPFLDATLDKIIADLDKQLKATTVNRETVERIEASVWDLKMCLKLEDSCREDFMLSLKRTSLISYYLYQLSFNLDTNLTTQVCTACKSFRMIVQTSIKNVTDLGEARFLRGLLLSLEQAAASVNRHIIRVEKKGQEKCSNCDEIFSSTVPYVLPCKYNHACCENCIENMFDNEAAAENGLNEIFCRPCNDMRISSSENFARFKPNDNSLLKHWKQFRENISNVFVGIIDQYVSPNISSDAVTDLIKECLVFRNRNPHVTDDIHNWKDGRIKTTIMLILATKVFPGPQNSLEENEIETGFHAWISREFAKSLIEETDPRKRLDDAKTCQLMLLAFEYCFANSCDAIISDLNEKNENFLVGQLALIAKIKYQISSFVNELAVVNKMSVDLKVTDSLINSYNVIQNVRNQSPSLIDFNLIRNFFVRYAYLEHGSQFLERIVQSESLKFIIPTGLLSEKVFTDIYLQLGDEYQQIVNILHKELVKGYEGALTVIAQTTNQLIQKLVAYRYVVGTNQETDLTETERKFRQELLKTYNNSMRLSSDDCDLEAKNVDSNDHLKQFMFLLANFTPQQSTLLKPLSDLKSCDSSALFLPTLKDSYWKMARDFQDYAESSDTLNLCPNGHPYIIGNCGRPYEVFDCNTCSEKIGGTHHNFVNDRNVKIGSISDLIKEENAYKNQQNAKGYRDEDNLTENYRNIKNPTRALMQLFMHSFLFMKEYDARFLQRAEQNLEELSEIISEAEGMANPISKEDALKFCVSFTLEIHKTPSELDFATEKSREDWENQFIEIFKVKRYQLGSVLHLYESAFSQDKRNESGELAKIISNCTPHEKFDSGSNNISNFSQFWSVNKVVSTNSLKAHQFNENSSAPCPLLEVMLKHKKMLPHLQNLPSLMKFFDSVLAQCNPDRLLSSYYTFNELLTDDSTNKNELENMCKVFCEIWNNFVGPQHSEPHHIMSTQSPVNQFIPSKDPCDSCALITVKRLIKVNNSLVQSYQSSSKANVEHPECISRQINIEVINTENVVHLADMDTQLIHLAMTFSAVEMNKQVVDFPAVERALGEKFVRYKPEILLTIKEFQLGDMERSSNVLQRIQEGLGDKMEQLTAKEMTDIRSYKDLPIVCRALRRINLTMKYACGFQEGATVPTKRQELDADQKIEKTLDTVHVDFVSGIKDAKLSQIVSLWQAFALQKTYLLLEHNEDPYLNVPSDFKVEITTEQEDACRRLLPLKDQCSQIMLTLNQILLHLNYEPYKSIIPNYSVSDCIELEEPIPELDESITMKSSASFMIWLIHHNFNVKDKKNVDNSRNNSEV